MGTAHPAGPVESVEGAVDERRWRIKSVIRLDNPMATVEVASRGLAILVRIRFERYAAGSQSAIVVRPSLLLGGAARSSSRESCLKRPVEVVVAPFGPGVGPCPPPMLGCSHGTGGHVVVLVELLNPVVDRHLRSRAARTRQRAARCLPTASVSSSWSDSNLLDQYLSGSAASRLCQTARAANASIAPGAS